MTEEDIYQIFDIDGLLSQYIDNFEYREDQLNMALDVLRGYQKPSVSAIEAGTGIGKSFAYLVPALFYAFEDSEDRTVIATSTINLQKQLIEKDLPTLFRLFDKSCSVALAVGRNNYLCLRRLQEELTSVSLFKESEEFEISKINKFSNESETGLRTDYPGKLDINVWNSVCSDGDFCIGGKCPYFSQCFFFKAKKKLDEASIIICNHHLLFTDSNSRYQTQTDYSEECILPPFNRLVIDEAHNIERHATDLFTVDYSSYLLRKQINNIYGKRGVNFLDELTNYCSDKGLYDDIVNCINSVLTSADTLNMSIVQRLELNKLAHLLVTKANFEKVFSDVSQTVKTILESSAVLLTKLSVFSSKLSVPEDRKFRVDEFNVHLGRIKSIIDTLKCFFDVSKWTDDVYYLEIEKRANIKYVSFKTAPLDVSNILKDALFSKIDSVICTSATMDLHDDFKYWSSSIGLPLTDRPFFKKVYDSPFDYKNRLMLLSPYDSVDFDNEKQEEYAQFLCKSIYTAIASSGGGALVLFTSIKLMDYVFTELKARLEVMDIKCLKQGYKDRYAILEDFKADSNSVLFATDSFWEGVDAPGDTLRLVIITKLPFKMPDDPIYKARYAKLEKEGMSGFFSLSLPDATMKLKQGFGRLMRHTNDRGIVLILDSRIVNKSYGPLMLSSLPESYQPETSLNSIADKIENFLF